MCVTGFRVAWLEMYAFLLFKSIYCGFYMLLEYIKASKTYAMVQMSALVQFYIADIMR